MTRCNIETRNRRRLLCLFFVVLLVAPAAAQAYVGPGAGFAFLGSAFVFILTIVLAFLTILFWPFQLLWHFVTRQGLGKGAKTRRIVILGLDGLDPGLVRRYMDDGMLPNFRTLAEKGAFCDLATTIPSISPVAWSSFQTGVNPGAHNIFDFLSRDKRLYLPLLASTETAPSKRSLSILKWRIPLGKPDVRLLRKSQPFWKLVSDRGVACNILRVPITYPPDPCKAHVLAAMCAPDLKGTQGSYTLFTTSREEASKTFTGGETSLLERTGNVLRGKLEGPHDPFLKEPTPLSIPLSLELIDNGRALLRVQKHKVLLPLDEFSDWTELRFRTSLGRSVTGICRFCLRSTEPEVVMYVSPININPAQPALPIASPSYFATYLAKAQGLFGTLGLLEDTWALNNGALDERLFLKATWLAHEEREAMFFNMIDKTREGLAVCVFDASDRIQHMFWKYIDPESGAMGTAAPEISEAIPRMYKRMDDLVARTLAKLSDEDVLLVMSDHGFNAFRRGVHINAWLRKEGFLVLKEGRDGSSDFYQDVDWERTKAFGLGLGGIYLNREGRERLGVVKDEEAEAVKQAISRRLCELVDPLNGRKAVRRVLDTNEHYSGMYKEDGPDLVIGCNRGYRVAWESVTGKIGREVFEDNEKNWCGDHCIDPELVPGILFANRKVTASAHIADIAPTVLSLFGMPIPAYMNGKALL